MPKAAAHGRRGLPLRRLPAMDLPFLVLVLTLVGFGLVMLCSASSAVALYRRGDAFAYARPQLLYAALGIGAMWLASRVDYHIYHRFAWPLLALSLVLLVAVLFMPVGSFVFSFLLDTSSPAGFAVVGGGIILLAAAGLAAFRKKE